jgi:peptide/nickel transport system permease protein
MGRFITRRLLWIGLTLLWVSAITFVLVFAGPGDPARAIGGSRASAATLDALREQYGLDQPIHVQYARYIGQLLQGDMGYSYVLRRPVAEIMLERLPATAMLAGTIIAVALLIGIPLGVLTGLRAHSLLDRVVTIGGTMVISIPTFLIGILLIYTFAFQLKLFPLGGYGSLEHLVLPTLSVALPWSAWYATMLRSNMLEVKASDYVRTGFAKGLRERTVAVRHMLPNALLPVLTMATMDLAALLTGIALVEHVFGWPGIGQLALKAAATRDIPVIMGSVIFGGLMIGIGNLLADLVAAWLDPRIRLS